MGEKISIKDASEIIGVPPITLRSWIRHKVVPFGIADKKDGAEKFHYIIFRKEFEDYVSAHIESKRVETTTLCC